MKKYKEILRYYHLGFSQRQIASLLDISRGTVIRIEDAYKGLGLTWEELHLLSDKELEGQLFPAHDEDVSFESRILNICPVNFKRRV